MILIGSVTGTVKWFNEVRQFGYLAQPGDGPDVLLSQATSQQANIKSLRVGQTISFDVEGGKAINVTVL